MLLYYISESPAKEKLVFKNCKTTDDILYSQVTFLSFSIFPDKPSLTLGGWGMGKKGERD